MKYLFILCSLLFSSHASAGLLHDRIEKILPGSSQYDETLILLSPSGRVLRSTDSRTLGDLSRYIGSRDKLTFIEDGDHILSFIKEDSAPTMIPDYDEDLPNLKIINQPTNIRYTDNVYMPSNLAQMNDAQALMDELKDNTRSRSQCYQRAHLWSIEMDKMANVHSQKIFLFFTEKYMREYSFGWWFHVAPFVLINNQEFVIDPRFFDHPADTHTWSNFFMPSHPTCKTVSRYQEYDEHQEEEYCYFRKVPMYYFEPMDIEARDQNHTIVSSWVDWQTESAYGSLFRAHKW